MIAPSADHLEQAFNHCKYGDFSPDPVLEIVLPSVHDPALAPDAEGIAKALREPLLKTFPPALLGRLAFLLLMSVGVRAVTVTLYNTGDLHEQTEPIGHVLEQLAQGQCLAHVADLVSWPHGNIQDQVRGASRDLFGQNRGNHLPRVIDTQRALYRDQNIVDRCEVGSASPDHGAMFAAHDVMQLSR